uniref:Uncharacterized protein n=1 Tax=Arundo donax TaxID=35708 RepID=A0A0A9D7U9_ARUDO
MKKNRIVRSGKKHEDYRGFIFLGGGGRVPLSRGALGGDRTGDGG